MYKKLLGGQQSRRKKISMQVIHLGPRLGSDDHISQCKQFSNKDIKDAFFSILNFKSPRPDGYNSGFFKASWV